MKTYRILSLGAGVQSTTVLLLSCRGELPRLDCAIFADTGWEPSAVYRHLEWLEGESRNHGIPVHRVGKGNIKEDALASQVRGKAEDGKRWASMPYHTRNPDGSIGLIRRQCTSEYKIRPIERYIREGLVGLARGQRFPADVHVEQWFGISIDEMRRVRMSTRRWVTNVYPLCGLPEPMLPEPMSRAACLAWLREHYPDRDVPRSACVGCPFRSNREWRALRENDPEGWDDACRFDEAIRHCGGMRGEVYLHYSAKPLRDIDLRTDRERGQRTLWDLECQGYCGD